MASTLPMHHAPAHAATPRTIAVTGSTGFVGRHICRALVARGHAVRALVRDRSKARETLPAEGISWVIGDVLDGRSLPDLLSGADAVVHCIGIRREFPPEVTFKRLHTKATESLIAAAQAAGVRRFIHISALGTRDNAATDYHRTKFESEKALRRSGLDWTILRPSLIHGPDSEFMKMAKDWVLGRSAPFFFLPWFARVAPPSGFPPVPKPESAKIQPLHIDDLAAAVLAALDAPETIGEVYALGGSEIYDWPTLLTSIRDALPITESWKKPVPLPGPLGFLMAKAAEAVGMGAALPFGPSEPIMATEDNICALDKARRHLGIQPRPFLASLKEYASKV